MSYRDQMAASMVAGLHVETRDREVIRFLRSKISPAQRTGRHKRSARHSFYRAGLVAHHDNRAFFNHLSGAGSRSTPAAPHTEGGSQYDS